MKLKHKLILALSTVATSVAIAASIPELNAKIASLLVEFNTPVTSAQIVFNQLAALDKGQFVVDGTARIKKTGNIGTLEIALNRGLYDTRGGKSPTAIFDASINANLTQFLNRTELDDVLNEIEPLLNSIAKDYLAEYADAVTVKVTISSKQNDNTGHVARVVGNISLNIDVRKLPSHIKASDIAVLSVNANISMDVFRGFSVKANMGLNPANASVRDVDGSAKNFITKVLALDADTLNNMVLMARDFDGLLNQIVNKQN